MNFKKFHESKNLFDEIYPNIADGTPKYKSIYVGNGNFTLSTNSPMHTPSVAVLFLLAGNVSSGASTPDNGVSVGVSRTVTAVNGYVTIAYRYYTDVDPRNYQTMLNTGSQPLPYEPYSSEVWHDIPHYIHSTSTDTLTTLPAAIYANDVIATVGLKGDMVQTGTPTPTTPIQPQSCGERTENLLDWSYFKDGYYLDNATGLPAIYTPSPSRIATTSPIDVSNYNYVTFSFTTNVTVPLYIYSLFNGNTLIRRVANNSNGASIDVSEGDKLYLCIYSNSSNITTSNINAAMLNGGSIALPYEPYGIKIPILNNSQTTNVYLGEAQSTRRIKKLVLTGDENILDVSGIYYSIPANNVRAWAKFSCSHCEYGGIIGGNMGISLWIKKEAFTDYPTTTDFKAYLAAQYTAGTPVCVWYILAEPETAVVNEPLRKIGTYADEVSGITIPTIAGANTLSIGTTLQPSEVTVNYKGWHPVQSVHEKSRNLFNGTLIGGIFQDANFTVSGSTTVYKSIKIYLTVGKYTLSWVKNVNIVRLIIDGTYTENVETDVMTYTFTINNSGYFGITFRDSTSSSTVWDNSPIMLNEGSIALPYEPYWI